MAELKSRIDFVYLFDVQDGNPNGDPDAGNQPRVDPETGMGLVTDVCIKRKIRNYVETAYGAKEGFDIFIKDKAVLDDLVDDVYASLPEHDNVAQQKDAAKKALCDKYYDIRAFGAVIATKDKQGQVRGPIQFTFARSVDPINADHHSITRMAVTKADDARKEKTMGRKSTVNYGLYLTHGFISANLARQTGFDTRDLELLWEAMRNMFDVDRSAARGLMSAQRLIAFVHSSELGNAPANKLFDLVTVEKKNGVGVARSFADYNVIVDTASLPEGVECVEIL